MLGKTFNWCFILSIFVAVIVATAYGQETAPTYDLSSNSGNELATGYQAISKVKAPGAPTASKVKPYSGMTSKFEGLSRYNPVNWGPDCYLPTPNQGQIMLGPSFWFGRFQGEARHAPAITGTPVSTIDFDDHLGLKKSGNVIWSIEAMYQFRPRWGIRYSFTPVTTEGTHTPLTSFNFGGNTFSGGTPVHSKFEQMAHRAGLVFHLNHTANALTSLYTDWLHIQQKLTIGSVGGSTATPSVSWDMTMNLAVVGLEFEKCLKNYRGNTLALGAKGGVAFLDDTFGWEAELALSYLMPIKSGRFGFIKSGYRYVNMRSDKHGSLLDTTVDGPFLNFGFLF